MPVYEIFTDENINLEDGIKLVEVTALSDSYRAANMQMCGISVGQISISADRDQYLHRSAT